MATQIFLGDELLACTSIDFCEVVIGCSEGKAKKVSLQPRRPTKQDEPPGFSPAIWQDGSSHFEPPPESKSTTNHLTIDQYLMFAVVGFQLQNMILLAHHKDPP